MRISLQTKIGDGRVNWSKGKGREDKKGVAGCSWWDSQKWEVKKIYGTKVNASSTAWLCCKQVQLEKQKREVRWMVLLETRLRNFSFSYGRPFMSLIYYFLFHFWPLRNVAHPKMKWCDGYICVDNSLKEWMFYSTSTPTNFFWDGGWLKEELVAIILVMVLIAHSPFCFKNCCEHICWSFCALLTLLIFLQ